MVRPVLQRLALLFSLAFVFNSLMAPAQADPLAVDKRTKTALVVGFKDYRNTKDLKNTLNDANLISEKLKGAGFAVDKLLDVPREELSAGIDAFIAKAKGADIALFYYAGHAVQIDGENFIVPIDYDATAADLIAGLYPIAKLLTAMNTAAKTRVLLLDACRHNPYQAKLKERYGARAEGQGLAAIQMPVADGKLLPEGTQGLVVSYATQPQAFAYDGTDANGRYAKALAAALSSPDEDFNTVLVRTTKRVITDTKGRQQPEHRTALTGKLYLVSRPKPLDCDELAAEPDNDVSVKGVEFDQIDAARALPACEADYSKNPSSPRLMHNLGRSLERSGKLEDAVDMYRQSAALGYDWAQLYLSVAYMEGTGVEPNMTEGVGWLRKAYEQGNRQALVTYTELDLSEVFADQPERIKKLQSALQEAGFVDAAETGTLDDPTMSALEDFKSGLKIEGKAITFQVLDRLGIVESLFPKRSASQ